MMTYDGLELRPAGMCGSSDTEACSYRMGSDMGDVGMQLGSSSNQGGAATVTEMAWISTAVAVTRRRKLQ